MPAADCVLTRNLFILRAGCVADDKTIHFVGSLCSRAAGFVAGEDV